MAVNTTERYRTDPEFRERRKAIAKRYYDKIKDTKEFKERNYARVKEWRKAHPEKHRASVAAYRSSEKGKQRVREYNRRKAAGLTEEQRERARARSRERYRKEYEKEINILFNPDVRNNTPAEVVEQVRARREKRLSRVRKAYHSNRDAIRARQKEARESNLTHYRQMARDSYHRRRRLSANKELLESKIQAEMQKSRFNSNRQGA